MSRIFHRPMFRKGGSAGGITSGLRRGYANGGDLEADPGTEINPENIATASEEESTPEGEDTFNKVAAIRRALGTPTELPKSTAGSDFLMNLGLNLMSGPST